MGGRIAPSTTLKSRWLSLTVDARGRPRSLRNIATGAELISVPEVSEAWRMIVPTGRHTVAFVLGSQQRPSSIELDETGGRRAIVICYESIRAAKGMDVRAVFTLALGDDGREVVAGVELENRGELPVDEVEFPVVGGIRGLGSPGLTPRVDLLIGSYGGRITPDVFQNGLPGTGNESDQFAREHETAMAGPDMLGTHIDLFNETQGIHFSYPHQYVDGCVFKIEKFPKEVPAAPRHHYPAGTARWLRVWGVHLARVQPAQTWRSRNLIVRPHEGAWHAGADRFARDLRPTLHPVKTPAFMEGFVGWTEIIGKTYLGEVFHDYARCAKAVIADARVTGLDMVFYYGHSKLGCEGADYDMQPSDDLGGARGFSRMTQALHRRGIRVILLDHLHGFVNRDIPEYKRLGLERHAIRDENGVVRTSRWYKETVLSCRFLQGPTPEWVQICPSSAAWWAHYQDEVMKLADLGADGMELDCLWPPPCHNPHHNHPPGQDVLPLKFERLAQVRQRVRARHPNFLFLGEIMTPVARRVIDAFYPSTRFRDESERIYRYTLPEIREMAVRVGNYAYDQVNKALMLGVGVETEIWGLRRTTLEGCPELARYIGQVTRFRRRYGDVMIRGTYRDTLGARVEGEALYAVLESLSGRQALVLRNPHPRKVPVSARLLRTAPGGARLWRPGHGERSLHQPGARLTLGPYEAAVIVSD